MAPHQVVARSDLRCSTFVPRCDVILSLGRSRERRALLSWSGRSLPNMGSGQGHALGWLSDAHVRSKAKYQAAHCEVCNQPNQGVPDEVGTDRHEVTQLQVDRSKEERCEINTGGNEQREAGRLLL